MTIRYITNPPTEDGWYLLEVDEELCVAEVQVSSNGDVQYLQTGIDYDAWTYGYRVNVAIAVICKLDLAKIAEAAKRAM